jgi:secondary thiamine-phosphate synthase enzyme
MVRSVWLSRRIELRPRARGIHLIDDEVADALPEIGRLAVGLLHLHLQHTSAALALNENASPSVRTDLETWFDRAVPDGAGYFTHTLEGPDDMSAHVKSVLVGPSLTLPVADGRLALGTWQGIYLCEFRDRGGGRRLAATLHGPTG